MLDRDFLADGLLPLPTPSAAAPYASNRSPECDYWYRRTANGCQPAQRVHQPPPRRYRLRWSSRDPNSGGQRGDAYFGSAVELIDAAIEFYERGAHVTGTRFNGTDDAGNLAYETVLEWPGLNARSTLAAVRAKAERIVALLSEIAGGGQADCNLSLAEELAQDIAELCPACGGQPGCIH